MSWVSTEAVIWLFPIIFLIHDSEEILTVERWVQANKQALRRRFGGRKLSDTLLRYAEETTTARFTTTVGCLLLAVCATSYLGASGRYFWYLAALSVLSLNAVAHMGQSLVYGGYTPGALTALAVVLPYAAYAYAHLGAAGHLTRPALWYSLPVGLILTGLVYAIGALLGRVLFPARHRR